MLMNINWSEILTWHNAAFAGRVALLVAVGIPAVLWLGRTLRRYLARKYSPQYGLIGSKILVWGGLALIVVSVLHELNFSLAPILGAAGIVGIAVGFASQTSVSNIISGLFLLTEKPFEVGDIIQVGNTTGTVLSIDTLSVKLRMFDNKFVRIPNEMIIKTEVVNITRFPLRRVDITVGVAYKEDIGRVRDVLLGISHRHPLCLQEPEAMVIFTGYNASSIDMLFVNWVQKENFLKVRNDLYEQIIRRFREEDIEIPFPHLSLYTGSETGAFPVRLMQEDKPAAADSPAPDGK